MSLHAKLSELGRRAEKNVALLETEEATKNALVMPFLASLGYDVFNPEEVVPEFTADLGMKKGEKVDYAIKRDNEVIVLVEAKKASVELGPANESQLFRYFTVTNARIAVLTNGLSYRFFSDIEEPNKMDRHPFLEFDIRDVKPAVATELERLTKEGFDLEEMLSAASDLKYMRDIRRAMETQFENPDEEFVKFFFAQTNASGRFVASTREYFTGLVRKVFRELVQDRVAERLRSALDHSEVDAAPATSAGGAPVAIPANDAGSDADGGETDRGSDIVTTEEELSGLRIVQAILCKHVPVEKVVGRDGKTYFAVLYEDNNRKPICRLWLNRGKKYLGLFDEQKNEARHEIQRVEDLYRHADAFHEALARYTSLVSEAS